MQSFIICAEKLKLSIMPPNLLGMTLVVTIIKFQKNTQRLSKQ